MKNGLTTTHFAHTHSVHDLDRFHVTLKPLHQESRERSPLAVPCQNKIHPLTSWACMRTPYFTGHNPTHCRLPWSSLLRIIILLERMLETQTPQGLQVTVHLSAVNLKVSSYTLMCTQKQRTTWWSLSTPLMMAETAGRNSATVSVTVRFQHRAGWCM